MRNAYDIAKYFISLDLDTNRNKIDGNIKLQKLLFFANMLSLAEYNQPLFNDDILAYNQGCVIENIRLKYKNDCAGFVRESKEFNPQFTTDEYKILDLCVSIFGKLSARELSELNHSFDFWKRAYNDSDRGDGYRDKNRAIVSVEAMQREAIKINDVVAAYKKTQEENNVSETVYGVEFIYSPSDLELTDEMIDELVEFSINADEPTYNIYLDNGKLVIY